MLNAHRHTTIIEHRQRQYEIAYTIRPGPSSAILYLHGLGCTKRDFEGALLIDELSEHTLVAFDFPGCGDSTPYYDEIPLGIDDLVAVTHGLVSDLALTDITVIGQSLGGLTALQFVRRHAMQVARFVNVEGNLSGAHRHRYRPGKAKSLRRTPKGWAGHPRRSPGPRRPE